MRRIRRDAERNPVILIVCLSNVCMSIGCRNFTREGLQGRTNKFAKTQLKLISSAPDVFVVRRSVCRGALRELRRATHVQALTRKRAALLSRCCGIWVHTRATYCNPNAFARTRRGKDTHVRGSLETNICTDLHRCVCPPCVQCEISSFERAPGDCMHAHPVRYE